MNTRINRAARPAALGAAALMLSFAYAQAELIVYEGFDIPAGEVDNTSGETSVGWTDTWFAFDGETIVHGVSETGLSYPGIGGVGGSFVFEDEANFDATAVYRTLPRMYAAGISTGSLWFSALVQPQIDGDPSGGGFFQVILSDGVDPYNKGYVGTDWAGAQYSSGGERVVDDLVSIVDVVSGETTFLVVHIDFDSEQMSFWVNPDAEATDPGAPSGTSAIENAGNSVFRFDRIGMWIGNFGPSAGEAGADYTGTLVDEIRLGETWADVAADGGTGGDGDGDGDGDPIDDALAFFGLAEDTGDDFWIEAESLGWVYAEQYPWSFSYTETGWLYSYETQPTFAEGSWFWDANAVNWIYTSSGDYPWVYVHTQGWEDRSAEAAM